MLMGARTEGIHFPRFVSETMTVLMKCMLLAGDQMLSLQFVKMTPVSKLQDTAWTRLALSHCAMYGLGILPGEALRSKLLSTSVRAVEQQSGRSGPLAGSEGTPTAL